MCVLSILLALAYHPTPPLAAIKPKHYSNLTLFDTFTRNFDKADAIQLLSLFLNIPFAHVCHTCQTRKK